MKKILLKPGIYHPDRDGLHVFDEPTWLCAEKPFTAIIQGGRTDAIVGRAPLWVMGLRMMGSIRSALSCWKGGFLGVVGCWIHNTGGQGVFADPEASLFIESSLIEFCGDNRDHCVYPGAHHYLRNSIFRHGATTALGRTEGVTRGIVERCLIVAGIKWALATHPGIRYLNNTIAGPIYYSPEFPQEGQGPKVADGNLIVPFSLTGDRNRDLVWDCGGVYWPAKELGGLGCYPYDPRLNKDFAFKLWPKGRMYSLIGEEFPIFFPEDRYEGFADSSQGLEAGIEQAERSLPEVSQLRSEFEISEEIVKKPR